MFEHKRKKSIYVCIRTHNTYIFNGNLEKLIENGNTNSYIQMVGKVFTKSCCPTFPYPWTKFLGKPQSIYWLRTKEILQSLAIGTKVASEMPVIRVGILLASHQMEFTSRPNNNLWNSKVFVRELYTAFGIPESKLYSRSAWDTQLPWPRSSEYKNCFLKLSMLASIYPCGLTAMHFARMNQES